MANQAAKKQKAKNDSTLRFLRYGIAVVSALYLILRVGVFYSSFTFWHWLGLALFASIYFFCYAGLASMTTCRYDETGELVYGGEDITMPGLCEYYFDLIYISWFVQVTTILSEWFWFTFLVVPFYAIYKLWDLVLKPWIFRPDERDLPEDEKSRKKREKMERKASRPKFVKVR